MRAILALEDGRFFEGESFGATGTHVGEICFNTSMTGYQEVLTDPSYRGQIVAMTYPLIGNYGTNALDQESREPHVRGFVIEELSEIPSNWRSEMSLEDYLRAMENSRRAGNRYPRVDAASARTRRDESLPNDVRRCRPKKRSRRAVEGEGVIGMDYVREVTTPEP